MVSFIPVESFQNRFYLKERSSNGFSDLSEDRLAEIAKRVYKRQEMMEDSPIRRTERLSKLERYQKTLLYLTSPQIHLEYKSFDEKLAFLIMMVDPELVTYKEFLKINLMSTSELFKVEDRKERERLMDLRNQTVSGYESTVREKIGFYDPRLLKYEELFFKKFYNDKELVTDVRMNNQDTLMLRARFIKSFDSISDERYEELVELSQLLLSLVPDKYNTSLATYSVVDQKKLLGLKNSYEQLALFVLLVDSDLDMLRIYEEESRMQNVEDRIKEQFGYYNTVLLSLERKFHNRFCPDKKVSVWTKIKND